jgi:CAAX protease family protein
VTAAAERAVRGPAAAIGWVLLFLIAGFVITILLATGGLLLTGGAARGDAGPRALLIQTLSGLVGFGLVTWAIGLRLLRLSPRDLRWRTELRAAPAFGAGLLLGALPAGLALVLSLLAGHARFLPDPSGGAGAYFETLGRTGLLLAPAALLEELIFRGVGLVVLGRAIGRLPAVVTLSALFALAHVFNPNTTPLGLLNIALAGVLLGVAFYAPGGLWTAWGAHLGWNATLAALDAPVSGLPFQIPWIDYRPGGPAWLTGGSFGPEGGLLATVAIALATATAWRWARKEMA